MTAWLDRLLGRVTMYVLVIIALCALILVAAVLGLLGWFGFGPAEIVVSALVLLVATYGSNRLFAGILRVRPQTASSIITALLLLVIFPPSLAPGYLGILALSGVIASASKYLLAVRRRHVVNPAAVGAMVISVLPLSAQQGVYALWWLGTPIMLPFVAVAAFAILFRTRKLWLGGIFLVVATAAITTYSAVAGLPVADALASALLSSPIVFFAGFMLSEPLTLPPRRWQQAVEAVLVGALFTPGISVFGLFFSSPQFALLVGNLFGFAFGQRRGIRLSYVGRTQLTPTSWEFEFTPDAPVRFTPGQFMELTLPHAKTDARGWRRVFSIASAPGGTVRFGVRLPERSSTFKKALLALEPGTRVSATSVGGDFVLPAGDVPVLLVAGGIGITPYISQLEAGGSRDVALVYAISTPDDLAYAGMLAKAGCSSVTVVSAAKPAKLPRGWTWVESARLTGDQLLEAVPDAKTRHTYLSGTPAMVGALKRALRRAGARRIHTDVFVGY
ncbi:MAG TPA: FAD-dependent oxidoreductase [Pseudolysinimonas sp.]|nr:FAD-dependent oxidoreductase [Pseudolysinimonas sp.]